MTENSGRDEYLRNSQADIDPSLYTFKTEESSMLATAPGTDPVIVRTGQNYFAGMSIRPPAVRLTDGEKQMNTRGIVAIPTSASNKGRMIYQTFRLNQ